MGWFVNEFPKYFVMVIWVGLNLMLFLVTYFRYTDGEQYYYLRYIIKGGLPVARGAAAMLNFNCMLILLPVCRNLLSFLRELRFLPRSVGRVMDKNITFHRNIAYMICFATALHICAHVFNIETLVSSWKSKDLSIQYLNNLDDNVRNQTRLNPIRGADLDPISELLKTVAGLTGIVITIALIMMVSSSTELIRRSYFEVFWFTHHLFVVFFVLLVFHGFGNLVRSQNNVAQNNPEKCIKDFNMCPILPQFSAKGPETWKWIVGPMFLYLIERCLRFYRSFQTCEIKKVVKHPSRVVEFQLRKPGFKASAGQYIFLHCPSISPLEWHPFTLTSCPEEDFFSVHIRQAGDWTEALAKYCDGKSDNVDTSKIPNLAVDGPFGTASTDVFHHENLMCIGAGIGITPFASILKSIWYRHHRGDTTLKIKKVYFYWICPDTNAFEWFSDLLQSLEDQMTEKGLLDFLEYNIYLTQGWGKGDVRNIVLHESDSADVITGLRQKTNYGRPNWDRIFSNIASSHKGSNVGVFFCGPAVLSHVLHKMSNKYSGDSVQFYYNKENF
ncbi:cytochrome b-245 heavy chain isoform X2 [Hydra vulgaris]|uniref:Cytochrome b-245 heavy chain isoform X2 n=1 Tax=Hydra vulgaris TaxID=6087 RepID=A0ABM4BI68_HYDVU